MESIIKIRNLKIPYIEGSSITMDINEGETVLLTGPNGAGKSTLAAYISGLYMPEEPDKVIVGGFDTSFPANIAIIHRKCGIVLQNPDDNQVFDIVSADTMFGFENLNTPVDETIKKTKHLLKWCGLEKKSDRNLRTLSEGERQRAAVAAIVGMEPRILILDEALSMQSSDVRRRFMDNITEAAKNSGQTLLIISQEPEMARYADRMIRLEHGRVVSDDLHFSGKNRKSDGYSGSEDDKNRNGFIREIASFTEVISSTEINSSLKKITIEERVIKGAGDIPLEDNAGIVGTVKNGEALLLDRVSFSYGNEPVLAGISYAFGRGRVYLVKGESGSGKSTLAMLLNGLLMAKKGHIYLDGKALPVTKLRKPDALRQRKDPSLEEGILFDINSLRRRVGYVSQNPEKMLFEDSVIKDVMFGPKNMGFDNDSAVKSARQALTYMNVDESLWKHSVQALSGGEKRKVGIAGVLANSPEFLILDESYAGLDEVGIDALSGVVKSYLEADRCVIVLCH